MWGHRKKTALCKQKTSNLLTPWFWTCSLQNYEKINLCEKLNPTPLPSPTLVGPTRLQSTNLPIWLHSTWLNKDNFPQNFSNIFLNFFSFLFFEISDKIYLKQIFRNFEHTIFLDSSLRFWTLSSCCGFPSQGSWILATYQNNGSSFLKIRVAWTSPQTIKS